MDKGRMGNFIVETGRKCFFCLGKLDKLEEPISSLFNQGSVSESGNGSSKMLAHSLQLISRYLRINTSRVFQKEYAIPPHLLSKVKGSMLKVRLCVDCSSINDSFSKAYRELEKIEMELEFSLKLILAKLENAVEREKAEDSQNLTELVESFNEGKLQIAEALRRETMQKCSRKLRKLLPRVRIQNLTRTEVNEEKLKVKHSWRQEKLLITPHKTEINSQPLPVSISPASVKDDDQDPDDMDNLCSTPEAMLIDDGADGDYDEFPKLQPVLKYERNEEPNLKNIWTDGIINSTPILTSILSVQSHEPLGRASVKQEPVTNAALRKNQFKAEHSKGPLRRVLHGVPKCSLDPTTRRYLCSLCPKHFSTYGGYHAHYKSRHLRVRYKCPDLDCKKQFTTKDICLLHHQSVHMQIRHKCPKCFKLFADKSNCRKHVRNVHTNSCASKLG